MEENIFDNLLNVCWPQHFTKSCDQQFKTINTDKLNNDDNKMGK